MFMLLRNYPNIFFNTDISAVESATIIIHSTLKPTKKWGRVYGNGKIQPEPFTSLDGKG